ncbi:hypothetical protein SBOR_6695 [Sclerotinia borealis F-4128]|uniref:Phosphoglycerate mutase family protein n=1 Tax=Sclerotinia borealis (strain F-4128) TaxID=1432307 RepID=W9C857_SCLBF|nr:hypothetical protein SBOR_6695 [Sclerotinia borealis F-4128]
MALYERIKRHFASPAPGLETRVFVHLMRHGEAYHKLGHVHGQVNPQSYAIPDPFLTDEGNEQAKSAREYMAERCPVPHIVLTSPLARTVETALHVFPTTTSGSITSQPQIVAYDDLRECGPFLCNVRQGVSELADEYNNKGVDFSALSPVIPPMHSVIRAEQRAEMVSKELLRIAKMIRKGGGIWKGVYVKGPAGQSVGWPLRTYVMEDIHIVVISHGTFMKYLLPLSHTFQPFWRKFKAAEIRTYMIDADGHLHETPESKGTRSTTVSRKVSSIFTSASR